jgi:hypothetical protein
VPVAPIAADGTLKEALARRGIHHYNNWVRLMRTLDAIPSPAATDLEIRKIDAHEADVFGRIVSTAFGHPAAVAPLVALTVGRPHWHHYLACDGDTPIAAAAMCVAGSAAWFGLAATDAAHRRRGAQQALIIRRLRDAADVGCTCVSIETAEDGVLKDAPSFRNLRRLGFAVAYTRPNYLWTRPE